VASDPVPTGDSTLGKNDDPSPLRVTLDTPVAAGQEKEAVAARRDGNYWRFWCKLERLDFWR